MNSNRNIYRHNNETFISRSRKIHGDKYDYRNVKYVNQLTEVELTCPIHGIFRITPKRHLKGQGCKECGKEIARNYHKNNWKAFLESSYNKHNGKFSYPYIKVEYENKKSDITIKCNKCGNIFTKRADYHLSLPSGGCRKCLQNKREDLRSYTYEELIKCNTLNLDIKRFEGHVLHEDKIIVICPIHGEYYIKVHSFLKGKGKCKKCAFAQKPLQRNDLYKKNLVKRIDCITKGLATPIIDTFVKSSVPMMFKCNACGRKYSRIPNNIFTNYVTQPCIYCNKEELRRKRVKSTERFIQDAISVHGIDKYDYSDTEYIQSDEYVRIKCLDCGRYFKIEANSHLQGHGCPYHNCNKSTYEQEIINLLQKWGIGEIKTNDRTILNGQELDIYLPQYNIAIEFDGIFWHNELYKHKDYHFHKTESCEKVGVRLIHIFEDEWLYKKEICQSLLFDIFNLTQKQKTIDIHRCEIHEITSNTASSFLTKNHLKGYCNGSIRYGLYYNNELVSVMIFSKSKSCHNLNEHDYILVGFCNKLNTTIIGADSHLFNHFISMHKPKNVYTYIDRRWSNGEFLKKLGFICKGKTNPDYYYVIKDKRYNRHNFRKDILVKKYVCPVNMSEKEFCKSKGWYRIYDCGNFRYEWQSK